MSSASVRLDDTGMERADHAGAHPLRFRRLWQPYLIVFVSSASIMILELVAGRILAPHVGVSLYTWTSVIGVVLAGISLGNYVGGRLADRWASPRLLGGIFMLGGLWSCGILAIEVLAKSIPDTWPIIPEILALTTALFFIPCAILGTISPVVAKLAVSDLARTGRIIGKIYAFSTLGSIVGTFATGFVLISWLGTRTIIWGVALVLLALGSLFLLGRRRLMIVLATLILSTGSIVASNRGWLESPCTRETDYFCIKVVDGERDGEPVRMLVLDRLVHSHTSLNDPTKLIYDYEKMYAEATAYQAQRDDRLDALFIGGGGYTFPRYMEAVYPDSSVLVIEIDPGVTEVAHDLLALSQDTEILTHNQDARLFLEAEPTSLYDLVFGDAFNDYSVPYHLTTKEFNERVHAWLAEGGLYVVNIVDGPRGDFLRAYTHTLRQVFDHVYLAPTSHSWRETPRHTFVLVATDSPLDLEALAIADAGDGEPLLARQMFSREEVDALLAEKKAVMLTDDYAPVDQMLAPVFRGEAPR